MRRVIVIDDKPENLYLLRALLRGRGWEVCEARHGAEALALAREAPPDLAVTDLLMPVMDGYSLLREWKADPRLKAVPLLVYTATYTDPRDEQLALDLGADAFILKPVEPEVFLAHLDRVLARAERGQAPAPAPAVAEEPIVLRQYNEALIRRLEDKSRSLELANRELRAVLDAEPACVKSLDAEGRFLDVNASGLRMLGAGQCKDIVGQGFLPLVVEEDRAAVRDLIARVLRGESGSLEYRCTPPTGGLLWVVTDAAPLRGPAGEITAILGVTRDVTPLKEAELRLAALGRLHATLSEVRRSVARARSRDQLCFAVCAAATSRGGLSRACVGLLDGDEHTLTVVATSGVGAEQLVGTAMDTSAPRFLGGVLSRALTTGSVTIARDLQAEGSAQERELAERGKLRGAAAVPLRLADAVVGLLVLGSEEADFFATTEHQDLVTTIAADVSFGLDALATEAARQRAEAQARLLNALALGVAEAEDLDAALAFALREVCEATGWVMGEVWVPDRAGARLEAHPVWHGAGPGLAEFRRASASLSFAAGEGLPGRVWRTKLPEWCPDLGVPERFPRAEAARAAGLTAGCGVPVLAHGEVVLVLGFFLVEARPEDARRLEMAAAVGAQLGTSFARQRALEALRESEARYRALFEHSMDGILLGRPDGTVRAANPAACRLLGRSEAELRRLGRRAFVDVTDPRLLAMLEARGRDGFVRGELRLVRGDGALLEVEASSSVHTSPDGLHSHSIIRDISERRRAEARLTESEARFRRLIENASDIVTELDPQGLVRMQGPSAERLLGFPLGEVSGRSILELVHPEDAPRVATALQRAVAEPGASVTVECRMRHKDGSWRTLESIGRVVRDAAEPLIVVNSRDMTERRRLEAQLVAAERMASMGMLAAGVAHEINNPLAALIANLEVVARDVEQGPESPHLRPDLDDALRDARDAAERLRVVVSDLRLFSRAEDELAGPVDVRRTLESSIRMAHNVLRHRARLEKSYAEVPRVEANESRLGQVFLNLLVNAAQAIPEGHATQNVIRVVTRVGPAETVVVEVSDTGAGMTPEVRARLFEPFFTSKPPGLGTGLGLAICQRIVAAAKGRIEVESEPGRGSTFRVILPARGLGAPEAARAPELPATARRGRVLVVDDELSIGRTIARVLGREHDVVVTTSGREALDRLSAGERFDVILCDLMMPLMNGIEFLAELGRLLPGECSGVIFLTGGAFTPEARAFLDRCSNLQLAKPFDATALRALIAARVG